MSEPTPIYETVATPRALALGDTVRIAAINEIGRISGILHNDEGTHYRVVYWADMTRREEWLYGWEIAHV